MTEQVRPRMLMIAPLPPPVHGAAMVSKSIKESKGLNEAFAMDWVNLSTSRTIAEIDCRAKTLLVKKAFRFIASYARVLMLLLKHKYTLCYLAITCHGVGFLKDAPFVLLCKLFGRKVVIHQHNKGMANDIGKPLYRWLFKEVYGHAKVVLLSDYLYPDVEKIVEREQVTICANGIKPTVVWPVERGNNDCSHLLFLSNLMVEKGVLVLLDALKILKERSCRFVCDYVGSETKDIDGGRLAEEVKKRGLDGLAIYHGRKYGFEKDAYFRMADIFVFPTFYFNECLPLVILEAMEYGLPLISSPEGGIRDEVVDGKNGFVVDPQNAMLLANAIEKLIDDERLRKVMGEESRRMFEQQFTSDCFEKNIQSIFQNLITV